MKSPEQMGGEITPENALEKINIHYITAENGEIKRKQLSLAQIQNEKGIYLFNSKEHGMAYSINKLPGKEYVNQGDLNEITSFWNEDAVEAMKSVLVKEGKKWKKERINDGDDPDTLHDHTIEGISWTNVAIYLTENYGRDEYLTEIENIEEE